MQIDRRNFIRNSSLAAGSIGFSSPSFGRGKSSVAAKSDLSDWQSVRNEFLLDPSLVHMTGLLLASNPSGVRNAIDTFRNGLDRNPVEFFVAQIGQRERECYESASQYLETTPEQIALTDSTTMGLGLLYNGLKLLPGQEILTTTHEHYSSKASLKTKAEMSGAVIRQIELYNDSFAVSSPDILQNIISAVTEKTRVLALTWVHSGTGVKIPVKEIGEAVARINTERTEENRILFCVDGVHGFGIEALAIENLGCDFFVAGCHKWLFGPRGTGIIWGKKESWKWVNPLIPSFNSQFNQAPGSVMTPGGFHSFELRWALPEAFKFHLAIGKDRIQERIHALNSRLKVGLSSLNGLKLITPVSADLSSGITCFEISGMTPKDVTTGLRAKRIIGSTTPYEVSYARLTPGLLNNEAEIDEAIAAVAGLCSTVR